MSGSPNPTRTRPTDPRTEAIAEEQRHVDRAYERVDELRERAERRRRAALAAEVTTHADLVDRDAAAYQAAVRVQSLSLGDGEPLVFGRVDRLDDERYHVGRLSVLTENYDPLVVDWRSDVAAAFYRATPADPQGLRRRRMIQCRGRTVITVEDQLLDLDDPSQHEGVVGDAALMAALTRERSAHMHDIVATIQREQDEIIRLPARGMVVITGGPGTGKTAVALHRVAYLLYKHRERLESRGVLVVGPSRAFAEYIRTVLPSLGETRAVLRPLGSFVPRLVADRHDPTEVAAVKGRREMAIVMRRLADALPQGSGWRGAFQRLRAGDLDLHDLARGTLPAADVDLLTRSWRDDHAAGRAPTVEDVALADELRWALGDVRPPVRPAPPSEDELTTYADRTAAIDPGELITAPDYTDFGHVVVDEAQDLSAMQWRMVARRGAVARWTVVGDLAQRTSPAAPSTWNRIADLVGQRDVQTTHLTVNYRTPGAIMAFAARLLPLVASHQEPPRSARTGEHPPDVRTGVDPVATTAEVARDAVATTSGTVAVIAPEELLGALADAFGDTEVRLLDPWTAKGLEFDVVVVVEPGRIADDLGWGAVYVALTRATTHLTVITAETALPGPLLAS